MAQEVPKTRNLLWLFESWTKNYEQGSRLIWHMTYGGEPADICEKHNLDYEMALDEAYWALSQAMKALEDPEGTIRGIIELYLRIGKLLEEDN